MKECNECPYRKASAPGWLGESTYDPVTFLQQLDSPVLHPCHKTVDWETEDYSKATYCIGAIKFAKNSAKMLRDSRAEVIRRGLESPDVNIFGFRHDFIQHHSKK